jgi:glucose-6-phosphate dehydrogenase assembly protein OpcA
VTPRGAALLPSGRDVAFSEIEATLAQLGQDQRRRKGTPARSLTASVIVIGDTGRLAAAADALEHLGVAGGVRTILISEGDQSAPVARVAGNAVAVPGLAPKFINNAVAALRLSSLPAVVWWRGGSVAPLDGLAGLADRVILDAEQPEDGWAQAVRLLDRTALTDLRWTRLTRWRSALAHLFELPQVKEAAREFRALSIETADPYAARLYAGWLQSCLRWTPSVSIAVAPAPAVAGTALSRVRLEGTAVSITAAVNEGHACLSAAIDQLEGSTRIVSLGDGSLASLIGEELGVRTRDLAFERALASAQEMQA